MPGKALGIRFLAAASSSGDGVARRADLGTFVVQEDDPNLESFQDA